MESSQNVGVELTEEELMLELRWINREIREEKERAIEVEFTTAVALAKSATLDVELETKKLRLSIMDEEIAATLKKKKDVTLEIQRLRKKYPFLDKEVNVTTLEDPKPEVAKEEPEEEVNDLIPFRGRLKEGDGKITFRAYR
uniref:Uncharacterized protein n=1 Tax=Solanum tuberosum TaxID=4113 RepID=M1DH13_SOLTU